MRERICQIFTMKRLMRIAGSILLAVSLSMSYGCGKDDEPVDPNKPDIVDPSAPADDPVGTVTMRMRNDSDTKLGSMYISSDNNFYCNGGMIASIGPVKGLGNITDIPLTGWSDQVAVTIGNGYVYYDGNQYYRIYAVQWLKDVVLDGIIGVEIKYQTPFKGVDEAIELENSTLSFSGDGGEDQAWFANSSVIPFTVTSDQDWCRAVRCTSKDEPFLYDGLSLYVSSANTQEESRAKVEIKTLYGKRTILTVVRGGETPNIVFPNGEKEYNRQDISASGETQALSLTSNLNAEDIVITSNADWFSAEITGGSSYVPAKTVRHIEGRESVVAQSGRASNRISMRYSVSPNYSNSDRDAKITISSKKGEKVAIMNVSQLAGSLSVERDEHINTNATASDLVFYFITNVYGEFKVTSDKAWCKVAMENVIVKEFYGATKSQSVRLNIEDNNTDKNREATITVSSATGTLKTQVKVIQRGISTEDLPSELYFDRNTGYVTVTMPVNNMAVKSSVDWCSVSTNGNKLTVRVAETDQDRTTQLTIEGLSVRITVDQSKYAVGDNYDEEGIKGIVSKMDGNKRLVRSENLGSVQYSIENVLIGTNDEDNGLANMAVVKKLAGWQKFYPAFAKCDELNVDGISGWYLPAKNEATANGWTSTEYNESYAYYDGKQTSLKSTTRPVYAVHQFVK